MRKAIVVVSVLLMCGGTALGGTVTARFVNMGAPANPGGGQLSYSQGMTNDYHGPGTDTVNDGGPLVVGRCLQWNGTGETQQAWVYDNGTGTTTFLTDSAGLLSTAGGTANNAYRISKDGTMIGMGYGTTAQVAVSTDGWATHTTTDLAGGSSAWNTPEFTSGNAIGANLAAGGAGIWTSVGGAATTVTGLTSFTDISADGNFVLGATATGFGVRDIAGGVTRPVATADLTAVSAISGNGTWVIGQTQIGTNKATRRVPVFKWNGTAYVLDTSLGTARCQPGDISEDESYDATDAAPNGCLILTSLLKLKKGVNTYHPYVAYTNEYRTSIGRYLTIAESYGWLETRLPAGSVPTDGFMAFQDGGEASPDGMSVAGQFYPIGTGNGGIKTAFFATIPEPATLSLLLVGSLALLRRRR